MLNSELLDELRANVLHDDSGLASGPDDRLWSDPTLLRYLNEAQRRFARLSLSLRDATTPEVVQVTLNADVATYTLHESVRAVISARYDTDVGDLGRVSHPTMNEFVPPETLVFDVNQLSTLTPGRPLAFSTDEGLDTQEDSSVLLTVFPTPSVTEDGKVIYLRVARMPLFDITPERMDKAPEIAADYHVDLCEWAAYRAFRTADIDGASDKAQQHRARFDEAIAEARKEQQRKMFQPARFAFGENGFSWST